ncbi:MAG: glycosyltransferase family 39 protein [Anaerolineales bacterium]|nr:glycosyltransferase family 39 protein [Anaerolineales bacterium]MCB8990969.1 glycosyltransferase family 39 protein [Ardenticatenaceae bacterium]
MMTKSQHRLINPFAITLIVILAGWLRFWHLDAVSVGPSSSFLLRVATELVNKGKWPLAAGQNALGITTPPLAEYLLAVPLLLRHEILTAVAFPTLLNLLAVPLLYGYARALFGRQTALVASFLLAVQPWAVFSGRAVVSEQASVFFGVIAIGSLLMVVRNGRYRWHLILTTVALTALTQLTFRLPLILLAALTLLFLIGLALRRQDANAPAKWWWAAIATAAVLYLPFWRFERTAGYTNIKALWQSWAGETAVTNLDAFSKIWQLATGGSLMQQFPAWKTAVLPWFWLGTLLAVLFVVGWALALRKRETAVLALWVLLSGLAFLHHAPQLSVNDFLFVLPAICLLAALAIPPLTHKKAESPVNRGRVAIAIVGLVMVLISGGWLGHVSWAGVQVQAAEVLSGDLTVRELATAVSTTRTHLNTYPDCELIVLGPGNQLNTSPWGLLAEFVHPTPVRFVEQGRGLIVPSQCSLYFAAGQDAFAAQWLNLHATTLPNAPNQAWRFFYLPIQETASNNQAAWRNGLLLQNVSVPETAVPGERVQVTYTWRVLLDPLPGSQFQFFNHMLNENGDIVAQEDGPGIVTAYWQANDTLITHFYLQLPTDLPTGAYTLAVGLYTWPDLQRVRLRSSLETAVDTATITIP